MRLRPSAWILNLRENVAAATNRHKQQQLPPRPVTKRVGPDDEAKQLQQHQEQEQEQEPEQEHCRRKRNPCNINHKVFDTPYPASSPSTSSRHQLLPACTTPSPRKSIASVVRKQLPAAPASGRQHQINLSPPVSIEFGCSDYRSLASFLGKQVDETAVLTPKAAHTSTSTAGSQLRSRGAVSRVRDYNPRKNRTRHPNLEMQYDIGCFVASRNQLASHSLADRWGCIKAGGSSREYKITRRNVRPDLSLRRAAPNINGAPSRVKNQVLLKKRKEISRNSKKDKHHATTPEVREDPSDCIECTSPCRSLSNWFDAVDDTVTVGVKLRGRRSLQSSPPASDDQLSIFTTSQADQLQGAKDIPAAAIGWSCSSSDSSDVSASSAAGELDHAAQDVRFVGREGIRTVASCRVCKHTNPEVDSELEIIPPSSRRNWNQVQQSFDKLVMTSSGARGAQSKTQDWSRRSSVDTFPVFQTSDARRSRDFGAAIGSAFVETPREITPKYYSCLDDSAVEEEDEEEEEVRAGASRLQLDHASTASGCSKLLEARRAAKRLANLEALTIARRKSAARQQLHDQELYSATHHNPAACCHAETSHEQSPSSILDYLDAESVQDDLRSPQKKYFPITAGQKLMTYKYKPDDDLQLYHEEAASRMEDPRHDQEELDMGAAVCAYNQLMQQQQQQLRGGGGRGVGFGAHVNGVVMKESVAMVKTSCNPYNDFKESMIEMIVEKDIRDSDDLEELLQCYLCLNGVQYHAVIVNVFTEVWRKLFDSDYPAT